ncbi:glycine cleavage system protein GcvH [Candidatus Bathyarchaeota archaeon]|nr:MAG: glycine cleavage system protein GcvH [Candidatus Bathyarchaeota archaeon]
MSGENISERSIMVDEYEVRMDLLYTEEHEWVKVEDGNTRVGVTDYAQKSLHEIVYVELPKEGMEVKQMKPMGTAESIKAVSEVYSPISGRVIKINERLRESPELVNESPYDEGWIALIEPSNLDEELKRLLTPKQYANLLRKIIEKK